MSSGVDLHVLYKIGNATINPFPFPHIYVQEVFPPDFYRRLREHLPPPDTFRNLKALGRVGPGYPDSRLVLPLTIESVQALAEPYRGFWNELGQWLLGGAFGGLVLSKFERFLEQRFGDARNRQFHDEALLVQDYTTYSLGPHTDAQEKVLSFLFYLPADDSLAHLGTSIYVPLDPNFTCPGGPHYRFEIFHRMVTMPFLPNTLFAFLKCANSFHGVEPVAEANVRRDLLLYDVKVKPSPAAEQQGGAAQAASPVTHFSF